MNKSISVSRNFFEMIRILGFIYLAIVFGIVISFTYIRDNTSPPIITSQKIVGYTQYFGYPGILDTILFFIITLSPAVLIVCYKYIKK